MKYSHNWIYSFTEKERRIFTEKGITNNYARSLANGLIQMGAQTRPHLCEMCGSPPRKKHNPYDEIYHQDPTVKFLVAHHDDYFKPLDLKFLCHVCHGERHSELKRIGKDPAKLFYRKILESPEADNYLSRLRQFYTLVSKLSSELFEKDFLDHLSEFGKNASSLTSVQDEEIET